MFMEYEGRYTYIDLSILTDEVAFFLHVAIQSDASDFPVHKANHRRFAVDTLLHSLLLTTW